MSDASTNANRTPADSAPAPVPTAPPVPAEAPTVSTRTAPAEPRLDRLPPFKILLHNDSTNDMVYVVETLVELTPLEAKHAAQVTLEAHNTGIALVLVTHRERAELYVEQFRSKGLLVTMEAAQ